MTDATPPAAPEDFADSGAEPAPAANPGDDVHIHKPKPLHKFREVLGEIGVIVIGILIAIALEQVVEEIHWAREVAKARVAIHTEMAAANDSLVYRIEADKCVQHRIEVMRDVIERVASGKPVPVIQDFVPGIGFAFPDNVWAAQRASQVLTHFPDDELSVLGAYYYQLGTVQRVVNEESAAYDQLRVLAGDPARLGAVDIAEMRQALSRAKRTNLLIVAIAHEELDASKQLGLTVPQRSTQESRLSQPCQKLYDGKGS